MVKHLSVSLSSNPLPVTLTVLLLTSCFKREVFTFWGIMHERLSRDVAPRIKTYGKFRPNCHIPQGTTRRPSEAFGEEIVGGIAGRPAAALRGTVYECRPDDSRTDRQLRESVPANLHGAGRLADEPGYQRNPHRRQSQFHHRHVGCEEFRSHHGRHRCELGQFFRAMGRLSSGSAERHACCHGERRWQPDVDRHRTTTAFSSLEKCWTTVGAISKVRLRVNGAPLWRRALIRFAFSITRSPAIMSFRSPNRLSSPRSSPPRPAIPSRW